MNGRLGGALAGVLLTARAALAQLPVGSPAPEFTLKDPSGQAVSLSQFRGRRYVVLDFWAGW